MKTINNQLFSVGSLPTLIQKARLLPCGKARALLLTRRRQEPTPNRKAKLLLLLLFLLSAIMPMKAQNHWTPDIDPYEDYMTITGYIVMNGFELEGDQYEVGCFIDEECRWSYRLQEMPYLGHNYPCLLSVWGSSADNGKAVTLKVYDHLTDETYEIEEKPLYQYGESIGFDDPYRFTIMTDPLYTVTPLGTSNGTVTADRESAFQYEVITLTIVSAEGYELGSISACETGNETNTITLTGEGDTRTFEMPACNVSIAATFKKTQATLDAEAVAEAAVLIGEALFDLSQAEGNTVEEITAWLIEQINLLLEGTGITVTADDIVIDSFTAALSGTEGNPSGTGGSYGFTVTLSLGDSTASASQDDNTITATPFAFSISINNITNGSVVSDKDTALEGTSVTLNIAPAEGYELESISACKTGDTSTVVSLTGEGATRNFAMPAHHVSISAMFKKTQATLDAEAVAMIKDLMETASYDLTQAEANTAEEVKAWITGRFYLILMQTGVAVSVTDITIADFTAATAGDEDNPSGTNGSYSFTATITKGEATATAGKEGNQIFATPFDEPVTYRIAIEGMANGIVIPDKGEAPEGMGVTLAVVPATGYELESISACKTGDTSITVSLTGESYIRTFNMPAYDVSVSAVFRKTQATLDAEAVAMAKSSIIEKASSSAPFAIKQEEGNTEEEVKAWLVTQLNLLIEPTGIIVSAGDITLSNLVPAISGSESNPQGTNGSFAFIANLNKGQSADNTGLLEGTIAATPYGVKLSEVITASLYAVPIDGGLRIFGLIPGEPLFVYNMKGQLIIKESANTSEQSVALPQQGIYIITNGKQQIKALYTR